MYPYEESIKSVSNICDEVVVIVSDSIERPLELEVFEFLSKIENVKVVIEEDWPLFIDSTYETYRKALQKALDLSNGDLVLKFDADNVFKDSFREVFNSVTSHISYIPRVNFFGKGTFKINSSSRDTYILNAERCLTEGIDFWISKKSWGSIGFSSSVETCFFDLSIEEAPVDYDATFFTKPRVIDHWKNIKLLFRGETITNEGELLHDFISYQGRKKQGGIKKDFSFHPEIIQDRIKNISSLCWGHNNFEGGS